LSFKDTFFHPKTLINCKGKLIDISTPKVMGIINVTPDSFYDGGNSVTQKEILKKTDKYLEEGADFIDVGGYSSRPGADDIPADEELKRVVPAVKAINKNFPEALISIDTFRAKVAMEAVYNGSCMINDISGGHLDNKMYETVKKLQVPYVITHMPGTPQNMQKNTNYKDVVKEVALYFSLILEKLRVIGINDIILDPGFGFGKTLEQNYQLLKNFSHFKMFGLPVLAGISRKSMICKVLKVNPENALAGTIAANLLAINNGADILRVHDAKEAVHTIKIFNNYSDA
jgi:dihydropteroate synthase